MSLELMLGVITKKINGIFSETPPSWTVKDGKDIGLRKRAYHIRRNLMMALDCHGTPVGQEILVGVGTEDDVTGIVRGFLDHDLSSFAVSDNLRPVSIERIDPVSIPSLFSGEPHRGRISFPVDYNAKPFWTATFEGGKQLPVDPADMEEELRALTKVTDNLYRWRLTDEGAREFLAGYNQMSFQLPFLFEQEN